MLQITIDADAQEFLRKHEAAMTLRASPRHGCCGGTVFLPIAEAGMTQGGEAWPVTERDGIRIYIDPAMVLPDDIHLRIGIDRFLMMTRLWVEGLKSVM
ncbi:MAG: CC/Se motif family (seleno)protein [Anaerolineales bacterium]